MSPVKSPSALRLNTRLLPQVFQLALTLLIIAYVGALEDDRFEKLGARQVAWMMLLSASGKKKKMRTD